MTGPVLRPIWTNPSPSGGGAVDAENVTFTSGSTGILQDAVEVEEALDILGDYIDASLPAGYAPATTITFQPSIGASAAPIYKTWAEVQTALTALKTAGYRGRVQFVENCTLGATASQLTGEEWFADPATWPTITIPNSATAVEFPNRIYGMDLLRTGNTTTRFYSGPVDVTFYGTTLGASGTKPLITCSGVINLMADQTGAGSRIDLNNSEVVEVSASEALEINCYGRTSDLATNDTIKGPVGSWLQVRRHAGNQTGVLTHANYAGTYTTVAM